MEDKKILSFKDLYPNEILQLELDENKVKENFPDIQKKYFQEKNKEQHDDVNDIELFDEIFDDYFNSEYNKKSKYLEIKYSELYDKKENEIDLKKKNILKKEILKVNNLQKKLWNKYKNKIKFTSNFSDKIYKSKDVILINLKNNTQQTITNLSAIDFHGTVSDGHSIYLVSDYFLLIHISIAASQASSLGIWDSRMNNWCFTHSEEDFYPTSFIYHKNDDSFSIESTCYYYGQDLHERKYIIDKNRKLIETQ